MQAVRDANPLEPWLWRPDWANGRIRQTTGVPVLLHAIGAFLFTCISTTILFSVLRKSMQEGDEGLLFLLIIPAIGLAYLGYAAYAGLRYRKYGVSVFQMADLPAFLGESFGGVLEIPARLDSPRLSCKLACIRRVITGAGKSQKVDETELWVSQQEIPASSFQAEGGRTLIPLIIGLEGASMPCDDTNPRNRILWRLKAKAKTPGIDFSAVFEVPVFARTACNVAGVKN